MNQAIEMPRAAHRRWPTLNAEVLIALTAAFLVCADNVSFWRAVLEGRTWLDASTWSFAFGVLVLLVGAYYFLLSVCAVRALLKPILIGALVAGAVVAYYIDHYNVVLDPAMVRNVLHTDAHEAVELLDRDLLVTFLLLAVLPAAAVMRVNVSERSWRRGFALRALTSVAALAIAVGALLAVFQDIAPLMRSRHEVRHMLTPLNLFVSAARSLRSDIGAAVATMEPLVPVTRVAAGGDRPLCSYWSSGKPRAPRIFH